MVGQPQGSRNRPEFGYGRSNVHCPVCLYAGGETETMTEHKNPAKAYLSRYRALKYKTAAIERAIRQAFEDATNTTVTLKEICVQTSGGGDMMANAVIKAVDATKYLEDQRQECQTVMREIMAAIKSVPDETQQTVLIEKYINGRTLAQIQTDIHYEQRNTIIIHGRALWEVWQYMRKHGLCDA